MNKPHSSSGNTITYTIDDLLLKIVQLIDDNIDNVVDKINEAYLEYEENGYELKRTTLTQEDDITIIIRRYFSDLQTIFDFEFQTKDPEKKGGTDIGVLRKYSKPRNIPLCLIEAKILPTPLNAERQETEYVCYKQSKKQGGVERFKTEKHGGRKELTKNIMFGYVQDNNFNHWYTKVNSWIDAEIASSSNKDITWMKEDKLIKDELFSKSKTIKFNSVHSRITLPKINLVHYWIDLN